MPLPRLLPSFALALALAAGLPLGAWGRKGHAKVAVGALKDLPAELAPWFEGQSQVLADHSSDPDFWKSDPKEGRRHFLEVEPYGGAGQVPRDLKEAMAKVGGKAFLEGGLVTWVIQDRMRDLADAFRKGDRAQVAFLASILSHYVADLHVPLHTTVDFDGKTGQKGVHGRWESGLVDRLDPEVEVRPALPEKDLYMAPFRWLEESHALAARILEDDRTADPSMGGALRKGERSTAYWMRFQAAQGAVVKEQLSRAAQHTAQMILLAWTLAGRPAAPATAPAPTSVPAA